MIFVHVLTGILDNSVNFWVFDFHALLNAFFIFVCDGFPEIFNEFALFIGVDLHFEELSEVELEILNLFEAIDLSFLFEGNFGFLLFLHFFYGLLFFFEFLQVEVNQIVEGKFLSFKDDCREEVDDADHLDE